MRRREHQSGFSTTVILLAVLVVAGLAVTSFALYQHHKTGSAKSAAATSQTQTTIQPQSTATQSTQGWNTYNDTGYTAASGISIKYPPDWQINIPHVRVIGNTKNPTAVINERVVFLPSSETPQAEWNTCAANVSADACGAAPGDRTLNSKATTLNGLAVYSATMQDGHGTYHVTVIRGNKPTPPAGTPFVEFTTRTGDLAALNTYAAIMASATFPN